MIKDKSKSTLSVIGLFIISIVWGLSFVFMKDAISEASVLYVLAIRFLIAGIPFALIFFKKFFKATKRDYLRGLLVGLVLVCSYLFQGYGCKYTTASKNALLSTVYGVIVPFSTWLIFKKKPKLMSLIFTILAFIGIGFITINGFDSINIGDVLTLLGGIIFSLQITLVSEFTKKTDPIFLTMIQFLFVGIVLLCFAPLEGSFPTYLFTEPDLLWRILVLGFGCTFMCFFLQSVCQKYVQVVTSGVIISLEAPFGVIAGVLLNHDRITGLMIFGIVILFVAVIGMQLYEPVLDKIKQKRERAVIIPDGGELAEDTTNEEGELSEKQEDNDTND